MKMKSHIVSAIAMSCVLKITVVPAARSSTPLDRQAMGQWPTVTFNSGMTEAPDETAQGLWLGLVTEMGFNFLKAHLDFLHDGRHTRDLVEEGAARDGVSRTYVRVRPVVPSPAAAKTGTGGARIR